MILHYMQSKELQFQLTPNFYSNLWFQLLLTFFRNDAHYTDNIGLDVHIFYDKWTI